MSPDEVLKLPIRRFWFLVNTLNRLRADEDHRLLELLTASGAGGEHLARAFELLQSERGSVHVWTAPARETTLVVETGDGLDPEFDRAGLHALKAELLGL